MRNVREIVAGNLLALRKENKLTQIELAKMINFSDKAVSRWENGEVLPDLETLERIAKVYRVPLTYLMEEHAAGVGAKRNRPSYNELLLQLLVICVVWVIMTVAFVYIRIIYEYTFWQAFVWAVPLSALLSLSFVKKWGDKLLQAVVRSVLTWSFLASIYLQLLPYNLWLIFLVGVPIQAGIIVVAFSKPEEK